MQCASKYEFGLFGSVFFLAVVISSIVFPALSDRIGRHLVLTVGISMQLIASSTLLLVSDQTMAYFCVFFIGLDFGARVFVGYIYCMEFLTNEQAQLTSQIIGAIDGLTLFFASLYFMYASKNWQYLYFFSVCVAAAALFMILKLPESPKFLVKVKKYDKAREVLRLMAKKNKVKAFDNLVFADELKSNND